jgi:hypothetical protein
VSRALGQTATIKVPYGTPEHTMSPHTRDAKKHARARKRRYLKAQERLERDCRQAQHAAKVLEQALARIFHKKAQTSCKSLIEWKV